MMESSAFLICLVFSASWPFELRLFQTKPGPGPCDVLGLLDTIQESTPVQAWLAWALASLEYSPALAAAWTGTGPSKLNSRELEPFSRLFSQVV